MAVGKNEEDKDDYDGNENIEIMRAEMIKLKELLAAKDMQILQHRQETVRLRKHNFDLTSKVLELNDQNHTLKDNEKKLKAAYL